MKRWQMIGEVAWRVVVAACLVLIVAKLYAGDGRGVRVQSWEMATTLEEIKHKLEFATAYLEMIRDDGKRRENK